MSEWTIIDSSPPSKFLARCSCGKEKLISRGDYKSGKSRMCMSCSHRISATRHGYKGKRIYSIWKSMRRRCNNTNSQDYKFYGGRGVKICKRWDIFENFLEDMGPTYKDDLTLDRINTYGNYEPPNCRWATWKEQYENRRPRTYTKLSYCKYGHSLEDALIYSGNRYCRICKTRRSKEYYMRKNDTVCPEDKIKEEE